MVHDTIRGGQYYVTELWEDVIYKKKVNIDLVITADTKQKLTPRAGSKLLTHFSISPRGQSYRGDMTPHLFMRPKSYTKQERKKVIVISMA